MGIGHGSLFSGEYKMKKKINSTPPEQLQNLICLFILKVANIRCFILIKCSEQEIMS